MIIPVLRSLLIRDLDRLKFEIEQYSSEEHLWIVSHEITNCGGNLCLHLVGNLKTFFGSVLNKSGYVRQRTLEFSEKNVPKETLIRMIEETKTDVHATLNNLQEDDLSKEYPILVFKEPMTTGHFLIHLSTHLGYHLGQINYHRRILDK